CGWGTPRQLGGGSAGPQSRRLQYESPYSSRRRGQIDDAGADAWATTRGRRFRTSDGRRNRETGGGRAAQTPASSSGGGQGRQQGQDAAVPAPPRASYYHPAQAE